MADSARGARAELAERLRARRGEIEQAVLTRVYAISDPAKASDPTYAQGLRSAVAAALEYGLAGIEASGERAPPAPTPLLAQARLAARNGVGLDAVMRRYFAGYVVLGDFLVEEAHAMELLRSAALKRLLRVQATRFDRLLVAVSEEHGRELASRAEHTKQERRAGLIERLLAGELLDASELAYDLDGFHLGAIASGPEAQEAARELASALDRRLLSLDRGEGTAWLWLGGRRGFEAEELERVVSFAWPTGVSLAIGEPGGGPPGWRLSHRQAKAALPIALRGGPEPVRYREVALLASIFQDELLVGSLHRLYISPLERERDGGKVAKETLRAYFAADRNVSSAGARLGINRRTVTSRLKMIEERLGCPLVSAAAHIEAVLHLEELGAVESVSRTT